MGRNRRTENVRGEKFQYCGHVSLLQRDIDDRSSSPAVLDHKLPPKPQLLDHLKDAVQYVKAEATKRDEKYQQVAAAEKNKSKVLEAKFQELFKKAKEEPITKPIKDIDLD